MLGKIRRIHFVGIGGIGMSGIAEVLLNLGFTVSGSDLKRTAVTERLERLGARVVEGHRAENVQDAQVVVVSSAVLPDNPEVLQAKLSQIPVIPRAEMLAELMRMKFSVAVAGAHGKTTTTSMIAVMLAHAGFDPTAIVGGRIDAFGSSARLGRSEWLVAEADESDRSFLYLLPSIAVVTNIDREHLDHYRDLDEIGAAFASFMNKVPFYGAIVVCVDPPWRERIMSLLPRIRRRVVTYGIEPGADVGASSIELSAAGASFVAQSASNPLGRFSLTVPGQHNVQNALAAICVGLELGLAVDKIREGLALFRGADRRFQVKANCGGVMIVDDYGHHPAEIRATLATARLVVPPGGRIWVVFQPHRYTRTQSLMDDFAECFEGAERVYLLDIYAASEEPIPGVTSEQLARRMRESGFHRGRYAPAEDELIRELLAEVRPSDLILTVGAGSIWRVADKLCEALRCTDLDTQILQMRTDVKKAGH